MKRTLCLTIVILTLSVAAFADIARPDVTPNRVEKPKAAKPIDTVLEIRLDSDAKEARLLIPRKQVKELRAALDQMEGGEDPTSAVAENSAGSFSRTQTIVSGMFLSLALVFGGMWFVRSGKTATKSGKALVVLAVIAGAGSAATFVYANAGPPSANRSITNRTFSQSVQSWGYGSGKIKLEMTDDPKQVTPKLIVPNPQATPAGEE